ncbi:acyl-ACP thioesterase domain-containing protein [Lactococcus fujiensis]|nr:acyl-ACP thioesterase domain-containing protein [Lactococcus fujiensis]
MGILYQQNYRVPFYESDTFKQMKISSLLAVALQISGEQSEALGRSDVWVAENYNNFWAVIEYELNIQRLPRFDEAIIIETEAISYNKFFCYRNFWFKNQEGKTLVKITSTWVLMNRENRKIERVADEIVAPYESEKISKIIRPHKFKKAASFEEAEAVVYPVRFSDLDMNGHVNNAKYYDWASDMVDFDFRKTHQPKQIFIKYNHEILYGTDIHAQMEFESNVSHHNLNDDSAQIEISWEKVSENQQ